MEKRVMTVLGAADPADLGFTQSHEHLLLLKGQSYLVSPVLWQDEPDKSLAELEAYFAAGGRTVVDAQPVGCGRMARELGRISASSGVHIIASTGFHKLCFYPGDHWIRTASADELAKLFVRELETGMFEDGDGAWPVQETGMYAGQIKTAFDTEGLTARYERLFLAAAEAHRQTGAPVMVHVENGTDPRSLLEKLTGWGVSPEKLIICHMDRACADIAWHREMAEAGCFLEYDTIGRFKYHSDEEECGIIAKMIRDGFADRLLVSLDTTRARLGAYGGDIDLCYLIDTFIPLMIEQGISVDDIRKMTVRNPARAFAY